ncbi:hypothetical protein HY483_03700 [Candidatus Woesearchaeota archaeon]|nr:hypothetical protein [Candidatus Woesearchaeota archaeon]
MEQTTKNSKITEPLNVLLVSGEFSTLSFEGEVFSFEGANRSFNSPSRFQVDRESGFAYASIKFLTSTSEGKKYNVVLTDLSLRTWISGSPVVEPNNYGLILALQATRMGVPYIGVIFNVEDAQLGPIVLEGIVGTHVETGKDRGVFTIQHEQQSSKMLIAPAPIDVDTDVRCLSIGATRKNYYALIEELLKGTPHEQYLRS